MNLTFHRAQPEDPDAKPLVDELSTALAQITGSTGRSSFANDDVAHPKSAFLLAKLADAAVACGALRRIDDDVCELKRMYSRIPGAGSLLLAELEREARRFGYNRIRLETRKVNHRAVRFYLKHGYQVIPNYGKYAGNDRAICFEKLTPVE